jgi:hypothetical protein
MGAVRANFRDWLASDRSKRAKIARELDYPDWHPSFYSVRGRSNCQCRAHAVRNDGARAAIMRAVADVTIKEQNLAR